MYHRVDHSNDEVAKDTTLIHSIVWGEFRQYSPGYISCIVSTPIIFALVSGGMQMELQYMTDQPLKTFGQAVHLRSSNHCLDFFATMANQVNLDTEYP